MIVATVTLFIVILAVFAVPWDIVEGLALVSQRQYCMGILKGALWLRKHLKSGLLQLV